MTTGPDRPTMSAAHRTAVEEYLGTVRAVSEEFAEAFRSQTETLRALTEQLTGRHGDGLQGAGGDPSGDPGPSGTRSPDGLRSGTAPGLSGLSGQPDRPGQRTAPALFNARDTP